MRSMFGHQACRYRWDSVLVTVMGKLDELGPESHWWNDGVAIDDKSVLSDGTATTASYSRPEEASQTPNAATTRLRRRLSPSYGRWSTSTATSMVARSRSSSTSPQSSALQQPCAPNPRPDSRIGACVFNATTSPSDTRLDRAIWPTSCPVRLSQPHHHSRRTCRQ